MRESNFIVLSMHGDMKQGECDAIMIMTEFRAEDTRVLITVDVWTRGKCA